MITSDKASLAVFSETHSAFAVSGILGLEPSRSYERGDRHGRGLVRAGSGWIFHPPETEADADSDADSAAADDDSQLDALLRALRGKASALAELRENYDIEIGYTGFSDSERGSFSFSADTIAQLGELGCGLLGTVHLEEPEPEIEPEPDSAGVLEQVVLPVIPGREAEFEAAFAVAKRIIAGADGFRSLRLSRGIERPNEYLLLVEWDSLEAHESGFRGSAAYDQWRALLHRFYEPFPEVAHFAPVTDRAAARV